jgi:hypothetical protein
MCITSSGAGYTSPSGAGPFAAEGVGDHFVGVADAAPARYAASSAFFTCHTATS